MIDYERVVLAGCVPDRRDLLLYILQSLTEEHFRQEIPRNVYRLLERFYTVTNAIPSPEVLADQIRRSGLSESKAVQYEEFYRTIAEMRVPEPEFRYAVDALRDTRAHQRTGEAITEAFEVLERGMTVDGEELRGQEAARELLYSRLSAIDRMSSAEIAPEGDARQEQSQILEDYAARKSGMLARGILSGVSEIDSTTSGFQNGELVLVCAYTATGKTHLCTQIAWHAAVEQGKNVFFATSETTRDQVRRRLMARHSCHPKFGQAKGLNSKAIKNGTLTAEEEDVFREVVVDFTRNPNYGSLFIAQVPRGATLSYIEARLNRYHASKPQDLLIIDYLALIRPDRKRQNAREEFQDTLREAKVMATSFAQGRGIPLISPWAMSQTAWREAVRLGAYTLANLAETSEAEKSSDLIISMLRTDESKQVRTQFLKVRDGELPQPFVMDTDYRCSLFRSEAEAFAEGEVGRDDFDF